MSASANCQSRSWHSFVALAKAQFAKLSLVTSVPKMNQAGPSGRPDETTFRRGGDVAQLVGLRTGTPLTQVRFSGAARDFSPRVNFQCRLSYSVRTPPCATTCINICAHVKDPVVHVRVRWTMETLKHPACILGWVAQLCRSWHSLGKAI